MRTQSFQVLETWGLAKTKMSALGKLGTHEDSVISTSGTLGTREDSVISAAGTLGTKEDSVI